MAIFQSKGAAYSAGQAIRKGKTPLDPERHEVLAVRGKPTDHWESALYVRYLDPEGGS